MFRQGYLVIAALLCAVALAAAGCGADPHAPDQVAASEPEALARLVQRAERGSDLAVLLADGRGTFFYEAAAGPQYDAAMGFVAGGFRLLDGWRWWFPADSVGLGASEISTAAVRPDFAVRAYAEADTLGLLARQIRRFRGPAPKRLSEVVSMGEGALLVSVPDSIGVLDFFPAVSDRAADGYRVETAGGVLVFARDNYLEPRGDDPRPVWVAVAAQDGRAEAGRVDLAERYPRALGTRERANAPGRVRFQSPGVVAIAFGMTAGEAAASARRALEGREDALRRHQQRLESALAGSTIRTEDERFNRAYGWARIRLEELVREDSLSADLAPGIPGAEAQRGWNTILAMEGAFLATGQWERAANMLRLYSRNQRFDRRIDIFGRAPSRFDLAGRPQYRTADAGAALIAALGDYLRTTGNDGLVLGQRLLFWQNPVFTQRGLDDPSQLRTEQGFIRNAANQTWVQQPQALRDVAVRGPAAVEVQARYVANLRTMERLARIMGVPRQAAEYAAAADAFQRRFEQSFVLDGRIADFLDPDGRPQDANRPSALYALRAFDLPPDVERTVLRNLAETLVYPHGVSTRPQTDSLFYPFLNEPDFYEPAAARYDGTVWTALAGPLVSLLVEHGAPARAYEQTDALIGLLLERGVAGGIPENVDAHPRDGAPGVGGAPVQPWSLAEFIRNAYQDYAGIHYVSGREIILQPHLPQSWGETTVAFRVGNGSVRATMRERGGELAVSLVPQGRLPTDAIVRVRGMGNEKRVPLTRPGAGDGPVPADSVRITLSAAQVTVNGDESTADATYDMPDGAFWDDFSWVRPEVRQEYPVMRRLEEERRLTADQVSTINPTATVILARTDPRGDDWGPTATYTYPVNYPPGVLDATYLEISEDRDAYYVRVEMAALAPPDVLGFQPTFIALTFDVTEGGERTVGRNANYSFAVGGGYDYIAFLGDGLRVEDHRGRVLGEFQALGAELMDFETATIQFALPKFVVPALPRGSQVTLLVGANDASRAPGRFRTVGAEATTRQGGGKANPRDPNIYDVVTSRVIQ